MEFEQLNDLIASIGALVVMLALAFAIIFWAIKCINKEQKFTELKMQRQQLEIKKLQKELQQENK